MNFAELRNLGQDELNAYLWKRLRLEEPLDPPLDRRFRMEPPEDFLIRALRSSPRSKYRVRLVSSIRANLSRLLLTSSGTDIDEIGSSQIASLAFLATAVGNSSLAGAFNNFALAHFTTAEPDRVLSEEALFHILRACATLQSNDKLLPFWEQIWTDETVPEIRAIAYYGIIKADLGRALSLLADVLRDDEIDLCVVAWNLATARPSITALGRTAGQLPKTLRQKLRSSLAMAGTPEKLLADYDRYSETAIASTNFEFDLRQPADPVAAHRLPSWTRQVVQSQGARYRPGQTM